MTQIDVETRRRLWITISDRLCKTLPDSGFHPLFLRGITHRTIGVSHTESRGFTHRASPQCLINPRFFALFFRLNLLNRVYLTESFNDQQLKASAVGETNCEIVAKGHGVFLHAGNHRKTGEETELIR